MRRLEIGCYLHRNAIDISEFLKRKKDHLEVLKMKFYPEEEMDEGMMPIRGRPFDLCPPPKRLKVLHLQNLKNDLLQTSQLKGFTAV